MTTKIGPPSKKPILLKNRDGLISQLDLEMWLGMRRAMLELEEQMAIALSKGIRVEPGIHTAELVLMRDDDGVPLRDEDGQLSLKLVIR